MGQGRILGIGGIFLKSDSPAQMRGWYEKHLGFRPEHGEVTFNWMSAEKPGEKHMTVWGIFPRSSKYFDPSQASFMINYIVDDLDALLERLKAEGVSIDPKRQDESYGRFAWIYDSDGNKIELWQPVR